MPLVMRSITVSIRTAGPLYSQPPGSMSMISPGPKYFFEYVAVAVQPKNSIAGVAVKLVDEKAGAAEKHVGCAAHAFEGVVDAVRRGQKLVFANVQFHALRHVDRNDVAGAIAAEGDHAGAPRFGDKHLDARHHALERAFHGPQPNLYGGMFPQKDVMLEVDGPRGHINRENGHEFAVNVISDAAKCFRVGGGWQKLW